MSDPEPVKNVAIIGASGNLGATTLRALIDEKRFNITVITRDESSANFVVDSNSRVESGDYNSDTFLAAALKGQDALIMTLSYMVPPTLSSRLIEAAAAAGVEWILPTEFGEDGANPKLVDFLPGLILEDKKKIRDQIEKLGAGNEKRGPKWIGVVTNPWLDFSLSRNLFSISAPDRTATLYSGGSTKFNTTTLNQAGKAIARLLALPPAKLQSHANKFIYVSSFRVSQSDLLASTQRVTGTKPEDWTIEHKDLEEDIRDSQELMQKGDYAGIKGLLFGSMYREGFGGDLESIRELANEELGLEQESLDEVVKGCLKDWGKLSM